jgi:ADP-ribose pyrophosphatase YjhB (NUDIX family)
MSKVLLINRADHPFVNKLALPGGFYLPSDLTIEAAASRELMEETSVSLAITNENLVKITSTQNRDPRGWVISVAYKVVIDENDYKVVANSDALYANWFSIDSIKEDSMAFDHYEILRQSLAIRS